MHIIYFLLCASLSLFTYATQHSHTITSLEIPNHHPTLSSTHILHINNDAYMKLSTLSKPFHCIWETSLGDNLTRTVIYNKNIIYENKALIPMEGKLYIYNNNSNEQFQEFTISIPKLISRVPFSLGFMRGYYFTGTTTRKVSHVDMRNGYMHLFVNNNLHTSNHFVTVYRTDYTLVCVHKESNVDMWKATVSEIELVKYGNVVQYVINSNSNVNNNNVNINKDNDDESVNSVFYYNNNTNAVVKVVDDSKRDDVVNENNDVIQENICEGCYYVRREDTPVLKLNVAVDMKKRSNSSSGKVALFLKGIVKVVYYYDYSYLFDIALGVVVGVVIILTGKYKKIQRGTVQRKEEGTKSIIKEFYLGRREIGVGGAVGKRKRILSDANNGACGNCNYNYKGKRFGSGIECNGVRGLKTKSLSLMRNGKLEEENEDDEEKERVFVKEQEKENGVDDINEIKEYEESENVIKTNANEKNEDMNDENDNNNNDNDSNEHDDDDEQCEENNNVYYNLWDSDEDNNEFDNDDSHIEQSHNNNNNPSITQEHTQIETISTLTTTTITPNGTSCKTRLEKDFSEFTKIAQSGFEYTLKARHRIDEKIYAIKIIRLESKTQQDVVKEIKIMKQLLEKHQVHYKTCWLDKSLGGLTKLILEDEVEFPPEEKLPKSKSYSKLTKRLSHNSLLHYLSIDKDSPISTFTSYKESNEFMDNDDHFIEGSNVLGDDNDEDDSDDNFKDKETKVKKYERGNSEDIGKCAETKTPFKRRNRDMQSSQRKSGSDYVKDGYGSDSNKEIKNGGDDNKVMPFTKTNSFGCTSYFFIQMEYFDEDEEEEEENEEIINKHEEDIKCN